MKRFSIYIAAGLFGVASLQSCTKDFLEKEPISNALPSEITAEPLLSGAYAGIYDEYFTLDFLVNGDVMADNAYAGGDNAANFSIDRYTVNSNNGNVKRDWNYLFTNIKNCNIVLAYVPEMQDRTLTDARRQEILGEAAFLRAWYYFNAVRSWKELPIILDVPGTVDEMFPSKKSTQEVYDQIIKDLEYALPKVRQTVPNKTLIGKGAVNALLAKVYAQKPSPDWAKVNQYCDAVTGLGYNLLPNYADLFLTTTINSIESIWETQYDGSVRQNWLTGMNTPFMWGDWKKFNIPSHAVVKAWDAEGDLVRKNASITYVNPSWTDDYWPKPTPVIFKYRDPDAKSHTFRLRYADIVLLKAEALTELNQLDNATGAQFFVNKIRGRVGLGNTPATTQAALRLAIEKERQLELAFEGHRMYDLIRTGRAVAVMNAQVDGNGTPLNYNVTDAKLYFPISQDEVDRNPNINK
jgi:starch-binding outer membrane protein, SusD/RagB family